MLTKFLKESQIELILIFLLGLTLPFKDQFSTIVIICSFFFALINLKIMKFQLQLFKLFAIVTALLIIPRLVGLIYGQTPDSYNELLRSIPLILIPFCIMVFGQKHCIDKLVERFFMGLLIAVIVVFFICEIRVIYNIISKDQPFGYIMRWRYLNFNFTRPIDIHPAYLGILVSWLFLYIMEYNPFKFKLKALVLLSLTLLLIQSLARNALIVSGLIIFYYSFKQGRKKLKYFLIIMTSVVVIVSIFHPSDYLRNKIFYVFVDDNPFEDNRFKRLKASYNVFKLSPFVGVGPGNDDVLRTNEYKTLNQEIAFQKSYNAHNQFIEHLSTYGIMGALFFICSLIILLGCTNKTFYRILILGFIFACLTESVLERSLGIKSFSIIMGFILLRKIYSNHK